MIEPMKRYVFVIYHREYEAFLDNLRKVGVVHICEKANGNSDTLHQRLAELSRHKAALEQCKALLQDTPTEQVDASTSADEVLQELDVLNRQHEQLLTNKAQFERDISTLEPWGDYSQDTVVQLQERGYGLSFYSIKSQLYQQSWETEYMVLPIYSKNSQTYFIALGTAPEHPNIEPVSLPDESLSVLQTKLQKVQSEIQQTEDKKKDLALRAYPILQASLEQLQDEASLEHVRMQTEDVLDNRLLMLEGWCPVKNETNLQQMLSNLSVCYHSREPEQSDKDIPILLKNNFFARLFEPVGALYALPNYFERDLTPLFAPFFMLFFGLCLGDAGYGILLVIAGLALRPFVGKELKDYATLGIWLGAATIICGLIGGTFFGISLLDAEWQWIEKFKGFMLDSNQLFTLALIIGAVQIVYGMVIKAIEKIRRFGWSYAWDTIAWVWLILAGAALYFGNEQQWFDEETSQILVYVVLGVASLGIFLFNTPKRNPLLNVGTGLWNTYNMLTGLLGDLLSYIRLFALGICGAVLGFAFNDLAINLSGDIPVLSQLIALIILLIGHGLNLFMSGLGAFVHPMRLTFVEFYKNAGFEGGGKEYQPFKSVRTVETK